MLKNQKYNYYHIIIMIFVYHNHIFIKNYVIGGRQMLPCKHTAFSSSL